MNFGGRRLQVDANPFAVVKTDNKQGGRGELTTKTSTKASVTERWVQ